MIGYRCEVSEIDIVDATDELAAKVKCFDEYASSIELHHQCHTVDSWRELSAKIEEALLQIHPAK